MELAERLNPYWSKQKYTQAAKDLSAKYSLTMDEQVMANAIRVSQLASAKLYKAAFNEQIVGVAPQDQSIHSYPAEQNAYKVSKQVSESAYRKDGKAQQMTGKLPLDCMEFVRIKKNASDISDANYRKTREEAIKTHKAWQTMDASSHPIVNQKKLAEYLYSEAAYRSDAQEYAQQSIYFPVQITEGYALARKVTAVTSNALYTKHAKSIEAENKFNYTQSEGYNLAKQQKSLSSHRYMAAAKKEAEKASNEPVTAEMRLAQALSPYWSHSHYVKGAKEISQKYNLTMDDQRIALALKITSDVSDRLYKEGYRLTCVGAPPSDSRLENYQNENNAYRVSKATSHALYVKDGNKIKTTGKLPVDCMDFTRCDKAAKIASDALYRKTRNDVLKKYRGWQTMDFATHPVITEGSRKQQLVDQARYTEEAKEEREWVYFPYNETESYHLAQNVVKNTSQKNYYKDAKALEQNNKFDFSTTDDWSRAKQGKLMISHTYRKKAKEDNMKPRSIAEDMYTEMAKSMKDVWSQSRYTQAARDIAGKFTIHMDDMAIALALKISDVCNEKAYKAGYQEAIVGKAPTDPSLHSYMNEHHAFNVSKVNSDNLYRKAGKKQQMTGKLPLKCIDFERCRNQKNISSSALYRKSRIEAIKEFRGWQTMDYSQHPLVLQSAALSLVQSNVQYKLDAKEEGTGVYFPCHITEGYNLALKVSHACSDVNYKKRAQDESHEVKFDYTKTERYDDVKKVQKVLNEGLYKEKAKEIMANPKPLAVNAEMEKAQFLKPYLSEKCYAEAAKQLQLKYDISMDVQSIAHALSVGKKVSDRLYQKAYNEEIKGTATQKAESFPEYVHLKNVTHACSDAEYTKAGKIAMTKFNLPLDYPILTLAKQNNINISDAHYQKERAAVVEKYKGYMRMDANTHPIVLKGMTANLIRSETLYKQAYNEEKDWIYFPYHITQEYTDAQELSKFKGKKYNQAAYDDMETANKYNVIDSVSYKTSKAAQNAASSLDYSKKAKEEAASYKPIETSAELEKAKLMKSVWSQHHYVEEAKKLSGKFNLHMDTMEMARALKMSTDISDRLYKEHYNKKVIGSTAANPAIAYPEYDHLAKVTKATSNAEYTKDGNIAKSKYTLCLDYPPFVQAKELSLLLSGAEYRKQFKQAVDEYKGFMRMDSSVHPLVIQGEKVSKLYSNNHYVAEWAEEKEWIYFPYHISPAYEQAKLNNKSVSDQKYKQKVSDQNKFNVTSTELYKTGKVINDALNKDKYSAKAKEDMGKLKSVPVTQEMERSQALKNYVSDALYKKNADAIKLKYHLDAHDYHLKHNIQLTATFTDRKYKEDFEKNVVGMFPKNTAIAYPEYDMCKKNNENFSNALYKKKADEGMHNYTIKDDYPMFQHAVDTYKNMSDAHYTRGKAEAVKDMKGFQRMDAAQHPVVQRGQEVYNIISTRKYVEDWMEEKEYVYFPVQITEAYMNSLKVSKYQSNISYMASYSRYKYEHKFRQDETPGYKFSLDLTAQVSNALYRKAAKEEMEGKRWAAHTTPKTMYDKELKEILSDANYRREARKVMDNYSVDMHVPYVQNSLRCSKFISHTRYTEVYRKQILGNFIANQFEDYPEYGHALAVSKMQSNALYSDQATKEMHNYTLVSDQHQFNQAKEHTKLMSSAYGSGKREAIDSMKGYMRMDAHTHPVVQKAAEIGKLTSENVYREDYQNDKDFNMYTFTITPVYEQLSKNQQTIDRKYTSQAKAIASKVRFGAHESEVFKQAIANQKLVGQKKYQKDKYDLQGTGSSVPDPHEMYLFQEIAPLLSAKRYTETARDLLGKYNLESNCQSMVSAFQAQGLTSEALYRKKYIKEVLGKSCDVKDAEIFKQYKSVADIVGDNLYRRKAEEEMHAFANHEMSPDMKHNIEIMKVISDGNYTKDLKEIQKKFSGFSRIRLEHNPDLEFQRRIQQQVSRYEYKREYEEEKEYIYFPVHVTEGYALAMKCSKMASSKLYKNKYMKDRDQRNAFIYSQTPSYEFNKALMDAVTPSNYSKHYMKEVRGKNMFSITDDPVSLQAKEISLIISNNLYSAESKKLLQSYNLSVDNPAYLHAKACQRLTSENNYKAWLKHPEAAKHGMGLDEWVMRFTIDQAKVLSSWRYKHDAKQAMNKVRVPGDLPEYKFHKALQDTLSPKKYNAGAEEAIKTALGFTRLSIDQLKDVKMAMELSKLNSDNIYKADYYEDKGFNMYPITITQFYEVCKQNEKLASDRLYKSKDADKFKNKYSYTDTKQYAVDKIQVKNNDRLYKKDYFEQCLKPISRDMRMDQEYQHVKKLAPHMSKNNYEKEAKAVLQKYNLDLNECSVKHARKVGKLASDLEYKQTLPTKGFHNIHESPFYKHIKDTMGLLDQNAYSKDARKQMSKITMPFDFPSLNSAVEAMKAISNAHYSSTSKEALKNFMGFSKLPIKDLKLLSIHMSLQSSLSDKEYKADWLGWLRGNKLSMHDTPELARFRLSQKLLSDRHYMKEFHKDCHKGMTGEVTFSTEHVKEVSKTQSERLYRQKAEKEMSTWATHMYKEMPNALLAKELVALHEHKYREQYNKTMRGLKSDIPKVEEEHAKEVQKLAGQNNYRKEFEKEKGKSVGYHHMADMKEMKHHAEMNELQSDARYHQQWNKEKVKSANTHEGVQILGDMESQKQISMYAYKKQSPLELNKYKGYFKNLLETPSIKCQHAARAWLSDRKYKEDWEEDKMYCIFPYWLTEEYKNFQKVRIQNSNEMYRRGARENMDKPLYSGTTNIRERHVNHVQNLLRLGFRMI